MIVIEGGGGGGGGSEGPSHRARGHGAPLYALLPTGEAPGTSAVSSKWSQNCPTEKKKVYATK